MPASTIPQSQTEFSLTGAYPAAPDLTFVVDLDKAEGSSFAIITRVTDFLRDAGRSVLVEDFFIKATACRSYEQLLRLATVYAPVVFVRRGRPVTC